jgi:hypothetical protein
MKKAGQAEPFLWKNVGFLWKSHLQVACDAREIIADSLAI